MSSVIENSAFLKSSKAIGSNLSATGAPFSHVLAPRAVIPVVQVDCRIAVAGDEPDLLPEPQALRLGADLQLAMLVRDIGDLDVLAAAHPGRTFLAAVGL